MQSLLSTEHEQTRKKSNSIPLMASPFHSFHDIHWTGRSESGASFLDISDSCIFAFSLALLLCGTRFWRIHNDRVRRRSAGYWVIGVQTRRRSRASGYMRRYLCIVGMNHTVQLSLDHGKQQIKKQRKEKQKNEIANVLTGM